MDYSPLSKQLTSTLTKLDKKNNGIYFTPPSCVQHNLEALLPYIKTMNDVLEPSCGSGEYITALHRLYPHLNITGIEYNETIYQAIGPLQNDKVTLMNMDYLHYTPTPPKKYDLIIGNPPYFVMKKGEVSKDYYPYFEGRPNIFILFIIKSLQLLKTGGILSFVLPKNFLNCLYYDKTRHYIAAHFKILHILDCNDDKYLETQQDTIILIVQNTKESKKNAAFILEKNGYTIFSNKANLTAFKKLYQNSQSLAELGFKVSVGTVVWNQCKDILTNDASQTRLIYSSDIQNTTLVLKTSANEAKKHYIAKPGITRPMIVINRGYGVGEYKFNYCLIDEKKEYLVENHLICIEHTDPDLPRDTLLVKLTHLLGSLTDPRTAEFINIYFGNNAINTTELNYILPVY